MRQQTWKLLSELIGLVSILVWFCAQLPQIYANYNARSVSGLSLGFLMIWMLGDSTGLVGCVLTGQLGFQTALACYYVSMDVILGLQYYAYTRPVAIEGFSPTLLDGTGSASGGLSKDTGTRKQFSGLVSIVSLASSLGRAHGAAVPLMTAIGSRKDSQSDAAIIGTSDAYRIGYLCAYISMVMYVFSRLPQIRLNFLRKSTEGVSVMLFSATLCGNLLYTISILCASMSERPYAGRFLRNEVPYIVGSAGTVLFDIVIVLQMFTYRSRRKRPTGSNPHLERLRAKVTRPGSETALILSAQRIYSNDCSEVLQQY